MEIKLTLSSEGHHVRLIPWLDGQGVNEIEWKVIQEIIYMCNMQSI